MKRRDRQRERGREKRGRKFDGVHKRWSETEGERDRQKASDGVE